MPTFRFVRLAVVLLGLWASLGGLTVGTKEARADKPGERKRALLAPIRRIVLVPPFFVEMPAERPQARPRRANTTDTEDERKKARELYHEALKTLEIEAQKRLPERFANRVPFQIVPAKETACALARLEHAPRMLLQGKKPERGQRFPVFQADTLRALMEIAKADAVLLMALEEPTTEDERPIFDGFQVWTRRARVRCRATFAIYLADGREAFFETLQAAQPRTRQPRLSREVPPPSRDYVIIDWRETQELLIENFLDELTRYTPASARP